MRVVLKPTTFKQDEILFRAVSPGGTSLANDEDLVPAETASQVIAAGGLGNLSGIDLNKMLAGTSVGVRADIGDTSTRLVGGASRKDLERMFQLVYLTFTAPRADPAAFRVFTEQLKVALAHQDALPDSAFRDALDAALSQNHLRAQPMTAARVDQMNLDKSLAFYRARFADASNFTFVLVGSFDLATIKPLVERYLASLPALNRHETARDVGMHPPTGVVEKVVRKGIEPKSQVSIVFTGRSVARCTMVIWCVAESSAATCGMWEDPRQYYGDVDTGPQRPTPECVDDQLQLRPDAGGEPYPDHFSAD